VDAAVEADAPLVEVVVAESVSGDPRVRELAGRAGVPVYTCPDAVFGDVSQVQTAQGILAVVETRVRSAEELFDCTSIVALDGVQDPGNAGTLMRTAAWFGVDGFMAGTGTVDLVNPKVVRAAMGAHWELDLCTVDRLDRAIDRFSSRGFTPYAADLEGTPVPVWEPDRPSILVLGSEAHGVSAAVREVVYERVYVDRPTIRDRRPGGVESLNVAVASGIVLYHWME
jgi:TrmH family RNA methyltransferase